MIIVVYGTPGPQGSKKVVGHTAPTAKSKHGRAILVESSKKVKPWRADVKAAAEQMRAGAVPIDQAISLRMVFTMPKPTGAPKVKRTFPMRMPDLSKLARSTEDALTEAGIWRDDARVVEYSRLAKVFPGEDP